METKKKKYKILIADDEPVNLKLLREILRDEYFLVFARNAHEMLRHAADGPDLILLDIMMPGMDGYEGCRKLGENEQTRNIPVIFITAKKEIEDEVKGFSVGAVDFINKPVKAAIVRARVRTHLALKESRETIARQNLEIQKQNDELVIAAKLREDVEQILRHDLKGPLNFIIGMPEILINDLKPPAEQAQMLQELSASGLRMLLMINRSHDLYKMERGLYVLDPVPVDVVKIIHHVAKELNSLFLRKKVKLHLSVDGRDHRAEDTFMVSGEELLCYAVLSNVIKNAIEASPAQESVKIDLRRKEQALIRVVNRGEVPEQIRDQFFNKHVTAGKKYGSGLGTYSADLSARTMGGSIHLDAGTADQTTIEIRLPL
ncbi:MAG: hybrid sensor histidine kinase/response regulator [Magnetococcales bacterium]|nr:hybrid sensor histidine kinase/response regulator [Magnetococcales bacterium]MBF0151219.1 hybrid sensor histidine kinase/response regulator [Magnetococcales bacterium]MBF0173067.1 hybrid sensor histidine kinase/response regulator [Magnetococcales bacterium]MBF0347246.1 hybrid sensor histidine kinase/response regulator [Magnetococcales bacterium]MBF0630149.1 hybrid sensor histidine kinase/response regulator [Magnetococcales bacterium]